MPKRKKTTLPAEDKITDYRHADKRKNIPPAGLAAQGKVREVPKTRYAYDPHLPPVLRFDESGQPDRLPELLETARQRALTAEEARLLAEALRNQQPWLEWAGKAQMIYIDPPYGIKFASNFQSQVGKRDVKDKPEDLTREPEQIKAYRDTWTLGVHSYLAYLRDRLIAARELLTDSGSIFVQISDENLHRVRMVMDEVFGAENFVVAITFKKTGGQSSSELPSVADYLLWYAKSIGQVKYRSLFADKKPGQEGATNLTWIEESSGVRRPLGAAEIQSWTLPPECKVFQAYPLFSEGPSPTDRSFEWCGTTYKPSPNNHWKTTEDGLHRLDHAARLLAQGKTLRFVSYLDDYPVTPLINVWTDTQISGYGEERLYVVQTHPRVIQRCLLMTTDPGDLVLDPTCGSGTTAYVAEQWGRRWITIDTSRVALALARQRLLTAKFDYYPCKGSQPSQGFEYKTVPHITLKSIAQNHALDSIFEKWAPILAEKLAALNAALKDVTAEIRARLQARLAEKERAQGKSSITEADRRRWLLPPSPSPRLRGEKEGGTKRGEKEGGTKRGEKEGGWEEWQVPFDDDALWPKSLRAALKAYRAAWRAKMDAVNAAIAASAPQETLVDKPNVVSGILRVSGPFTVEGVQPAEESLDLEDSSLLAGEGAVRFDGAPEALTPFPPTPSGCGTGSPAGGRGEIESINAKAYLEKMLRLLQQDGVRFPDNKVLKFHRLDPLQNSILHAEGEWGNGGEGMGMPSPRNGREGQGESNGIPMPLRKVAVSIGPQYGPITAKQVEECLWAASRWGGYDDLVFAGFTIDGAAQGVIQDDPNPRVRCHLAHIRPDVAMGDLLKDTPGSQLFTVFGLPRVKLSRAKSGEWMVEMQGVDIYDPVANTIRATDAGKVAAWFLDSDYDGRTFCITQAFFPDSDAWKKLARALKTTVDPERFEAFSGTRSLPFAAGEHKRIAVKVIDPRGNEVMRVMSLGEQKYKM